MIDHSSAPAFSSPLPMVSQFLLLTLLGLTATSAFPKYEKSQEISGKFSLATHRFLEAFKGIMPCGDGEDIPVLAPFNIPFLPLTTDIEDFNFEGNATDFRIDGLNSFELLSISDHGNRGLVTYDFLVRKIQVLGSAELEGYINVAGFKVPFAWSGPFNDALFDLRFVGIFSFASSLTNPNGLRIVDFKQTLFLGGVDLNKRSSLWNMVASYFFEKIKSQIREFFFPDFSDYNEDLANMSMDKLLYIMRRQAEIWETIKCRA